VPGPVTAVIRLSVLRRADARSSFLLPTIHAAD